MNNPSLPAGTVDRPGRWPALIDRMVSYAVLPGDRPDRVRTKRLFTAAIWISLVTSFVSVYQFVLFDALWGAVALAVPILAAAVALVAMRVDPKNFPGVMHIVAAGTMITTFTVIILFGGVYESAGNTAWAILTVIGAVAIFADRRAHLWLGIFITTTIGAFLVSQTIEPLYVLPNREYFSLFNLIVVCVFIYFVLYYFVRQSSRLYRQTESLLHNILPVAVADRLSHAETRIADRFASASILFADVVGFTPIAADLDPDDVIDLLNDVFTAFDDLVAERGLEKIKTIGDEYMVAAGVPVASADHATTICDLGLAMQDVLSNREFGGRRLEMRIGVASGPVIAGIIGRQKFSYDLWGDTVNLASRMETTGVPRRIQISGSTRHLVESSFAVEERGVVDVKGRGPTTTWFLVGRHT